GVAVVWAQTDEGIRGFAVPTGSAGFSAPEIKHKWSLRASVTSELVLDDVRLPADAVLPGVTGLRGPLSCLSHARYGIVWGAMGAARSCFETAVDYAKSREQFGRPIGGFQLTQAKLADMAVELHKGILLAHHLGRRMDAGRLRPEQVSFGKLNNVREAIDICRTARTIRGANGLSLEYPVMRHATNLESVLTYEGTVEMHQLVLGKALTGLDAFRRTAARCTRATAGPVSGPASALVVEAVRTVRGRLPADHLGVGGAQQEHPVGHPLDGPAQTEDQPGGEVHHALGVGG